eukprot:jgi/Mesvir1/11967/Mv00286-RA.1
MTSRMRDLIRQVRSCKTAAEERAVIAKECAALRSAFKEQDSTHRHRSVAKLMFIHMLGYPTHFGQMECLKLIASPTFPEKRIGYLGLMLLLDERQEVLMLVTNSLKNDLNHSNQYIVGLALCSLGNISSTEMVRDLAPEVEKLLSNSNSYIRKKAALCAIRVIRKVPELIESFTDKVGILLKDRHHGVLLSATTLAVEICKESPASIERFRGYVTALVRILKNLVLSGFTPEHDVGGITDPFLQVKVLQLLRLLGKGNAECSDAMSDILAQVASNTESKKNAGNAILYECVQTIMAVESIGGLRVLAVNILGRFLVNRDNNIRYVALNTLAKVVAVDTQAVQRHRNTIVDCVKDSDVSIRRRALELVYALVNENNITTLTKELLEYLQVSDQEFKGDLTNKICSLVQRFSPDKQWQLDTMVKVLKQAGNYVKEEVCRNLIILISNTLELQGYSVRAFYKALVTEKGQSSLVNVGVWCIGEFGEMLTSETNMLTGEEPLQVSEQEVVRLLESLLTSLNTGLVSREYILMALIKLSGRFTQTLGDIQRLLATHRSSINLEMQARSCEFSQLFEASGDVRAQAVVRMPMMEEQKARADEKLLAAATGAAPAAATAAPAASTVGAEKPSANGFALDVPAAPAAKSAVMDLVNLLDMDADAPAAAPPPAAVAAVNPLMDAFGAAPVVAPVAAPAAPAVTASAMDALFGLLDAPAPTPAAPSMPAVAPVAAAPVAAMAPSRPAPPDPKDLLAMMGPSQPMGVAGGGMLGMMGGPMAPAPMAPLGGWNAPAAPMMAPAGFPPFIAFQKNGLVVTFAATKDATNPQVTLITATYTNATPTPLTEYSFQAAVPKFMQLRLDPASGTVVPPNNIGNITQTMHITNTMHGQKPLVMRLRIQYKVNGVPVLEQGEVNTFPPGL